MSDMKPCGCLTDGYNWLGQCNYHQATLTQLKRSSALLCELLDAIDARWAGESERKRSNAISPRMEEAIAAARRWAGR